MDLLPYVWGYGSAPWKLMGFFSFGFNKIVSISST